MAESSGAGLLKQKLIWVGKMKLPTRKVGSKHNGTQQCSWNQELCTCTRSMAFISAWMFPAKVSWGWKRWNASSMGLTFQATGVLQVHLWALCGLWFAVTILPWDLGFATVMRVYLGTGSTAGRAHLQLPHLSQLDTVGAVQAHKDWEMRENLDRMELSVSMTWAAASVIWFSEPCSSKVEM